jgi:hypothetical protein
MPFHPGDRVRIRALKDVGSARLLHGLTGEVVGPHPIAIGWVKVRLDANPISPHREWSVAADRLTYEGESRERTTPSPGVGIYP